MWGLRFGCRYFSAQRSWCTRKLQSRSICRNRERICFKMGARCSRRRSPAAGMDISPKEAHSRSSRRNEPIIRACMETSSMRTEIRSWRTPMPICQCRVAANLFPRRCIFLCGLTGLTECMPGICRVIRRRTAASACPSNTRLHSLIPSVQGRQWRYLAGHRLDVI